MSVNGKTDCRGGWSGWGGERKGHGEMRRIKILYLYTLKTT
jgi:hypothetical protein